MPPQGSTCSFSSAKSRLSNSSLKSFKSKSTCSQKSTHKICKTGSTFRKSLLFKINPLPLNQNNNNDLDLDPEFQDDCKDGSHRDFAENLNDQLLQLAEGYADPTPSVLLGDFEPESEEEFSGNGDIDLTLSVRSKTSEDKDRGKQTFLADALSTCFEHVNIFF